MIIKRHAKSVKPLSLQEVEAKVKAGEGQVFEAGKTLGSLREDIESKKKEIQVVSDEVKQLHSNAAIASKEVEEVQNQKRTAEGELASAKANLSEVLKSTDNAIAAGKQGVAKADSERGQIIVQGNEAESKARETIAELKEREAGLKASITKLEDKIISSKKEEKRLLVITQAIPSAMLELEKVNRQILELKVEEKKQGEKLQIAKGLLNDENRKLDEAKALVLTTEKEVEAKLAQLVNKEAEVEQKSATLRGLQEGLDRTEARIDRKIQENGLKAYLKRDRTAEEVTET